MVQDWVNCLVLILFVPFSMMGFLSIWRYDSRRNKDVCIHVCVLSCGHWLITGVFQVELTKEDLAQIIQETRVKLRSVWACSHYIFFCLVHGWGPWGWWGQPWILGRTLGLCYSISVSRSRTPWARKGTSVHTYPTLNQIKGNEAHLISSAVCTFPGRMEGTKGAVKWESLDEYVVRAIH